MKMALWQRLIIPTLLGWGIGSLTPSAQAAQFEQQPLDQNRFIVLAAPGGDIGYKLLILEQLNNSRPCWVESGSNPSDVQPLLLDFDFTGICTRLVDSNGFSVRTAGQDQGLLYSLRILRQENDLVLVAAAVNQRNTYVEIGRTNGMPTGFSRIILNPGWHLTRRAFEGRPVGHVYLTYNEQPIDALLTNATTTSPRPTVLPTVPPSPTPTVSPEALPVPSLPPATVAPTPNPLPSLSASAASSASLPQSASQPEIASSSGAAPSLGGLLPPPPTTAASLEATTPTQMTRPRNQTSELADSGASSSGTSSEAANSAPVNSEITSSETAMAQASTFQVVVVADSAEVQDKVRSLAPNAFLTTINGQVVMQVGVFRERSEADRLQQRLSLEGLPTAVIPVR